MKRESLNAMLTDLYELTMAYGYWKSGMWDRESVFVLFYRTQPYGGGYAVAAGLESIVAYVEHFSFEPEDLDYLRTLENPAGEPLFEEPFLEFLGELKLEVDIDAVPEGTIVFPGEPLIRVRGPLLHAQILETALLNEFNFQTLIATKGARLRQVAPGDSIMEFGARRAQGAEAGILAARAAFLGGVDSTSNVLAAKRYGIPVAGTHAHSWIMAFDSERESFETYAQALPDSCVFLVDTYDTLEGVRDAIHVGNHLRKRGKDMIGIRLDSGDLLALSLEARRLLDEAGFEEAKIVASNDLDEFRIEELKRSGAPITVWGVGTRLATGHPDAALDGVYKLTAIRNDDGTWAYKAKRSAQIAKASPPGILQVRRYLDEHGRFLGDVVVDDVGELGAACEAVSNRGEERRGFTEMDFEELLVPVFRRGKSVVELPPLREIQRKVQEDLEKFPLACRRLDQPETYFVGTELSLQRVKAELLMLTR